MKKLKEKAWKSSKIKPSESFKNEELANKIDNQVDIKKDVLKILETSRKDKVIGSSLEAHVTIYVKSESIRSELKDMGSNIERFFV